MAPVAQTSEKVRVIAKDVTSSMTAEVELARGMQAGTAAQVLAAELQLPDNVPWGLRDDVSAENLDDEVSLGDLIGDQDPETGAQVTVVPKTHLGCRP